MATSLMLLPPRPDTQSVSDYTRVGRARQSQKRRYGSQVTPTAQCFVELLAISQSQGRIQKPTEALIRPWTRPESGTVVETHGALAKLFLELGDIGEQDLDRAVEEVRHRDYE